MADRGGGPGPWLLAGVILAAPALYMIRVMSAGWTPWHTALVLAIGGACLWRFAGVFGVGAEHALRNRRTIDDAHVVEVQARVQPPQLTDTARAGLYTAQAEVLRAGMDAARVGERREVPIRVNGRIWPGEGEDERGDFE